MSRRSWRRRPGLIPQAATRLWRAVRWLIARPGLWTLVVVGGAIAAGGWFALNRTEAFRLERIDAPPGVAFTIPTGLIGRSIWRVDLQRLADDLKTQQPHLKRIRVIRRLPDTLVIEVLARVPVAQVKVSSNWRAVDREGVVLPALGRTPAAHLTVLRDPKTDEERQRAVRLVELLQRAPELIGHRVTSLDVGDAEQLSFVLDETLEVRCGREDQLPQQLDRVRTALRLLALRSLDAQYLDVRFDEPIIGQRLAKNSR